MTPKTSLGLLFAFIVILGIARSDFSSGPIAKKTHVSFWNGFTGPDGRVMLQLIRRFNEENPDVDVSMQRMEWATYYNKLMVAAVDGRGPEIFVIHASTLPRMNRAGFIGAASNLYQGAQAIPIDDFDDYVLDQVRYGDQMIGVPLDIHPQGLYCNAEMLKKAGIVDASGRAKVPENREEFLRAATTMRADPQWGYALTNWRLNFFSIMPQFDGRFLDQNGRADLANPNNVEALEFLKSLVAKKLVPPPENRLGWVGFRQKKVGMVWDGVYMLGDLLRLQNLNYVGGPIPTLGHHPGTNADSHVLCMRANLTPPQREAGERFIRFLSQHSIQWAAAGQVPARKSVRATPEFAKMQVQSAFARQIPWMMYPPRTAILFELSLEVDVAVEKVMRGRASPREALTLANEHTQAFLDRDAREREGASKP